jgi:hypothetical protein
MNTAYAWRAATLYKALDFDAPTRQPELDTAKI